MSRCSVCDIRLNDIDFKNCRDTCRECEFIILQCNSELEITFDKDYVFESLEEGISITHDLDYYDSQDFIENNEEST
jgi:hypothetical protein